MNAEEIINRYFNQSRIPKFYAGEQIINFLSSYSSILDLTENPREIYEITTFISKYSKNIPKKYNKKRNKYNYNKLFKQVSNNKLELFEHFCNEGIEQIDQFRYPSGDKIISYRREVLNSNINYNKGMIIRTRLTQTKSSERKEKDLKEIIKAFEIYNSIVKNHSEISVIFGNEQIIKAKRALFKIDREENNRLDILKDCNETIEIINKQYKSPSIGRIKKYVVETRDHLRNQKSYY